MTKILYWLPRVLAILFIAFVSIFALDVFGEPQWFLALLMHLIPSFVLVAITAFAWKREQLGGLAFLAAGVFFLFFTHFEALVIAIPALVIGALFLASGKYSPKA
jgi:hypothetical protein